MVTAIQRFTYSIAIALTLVMAPIASAATTFSNTLTGFTGDSTQAATQAAVAAAGFNFFSTAGFDEVAMTDPTVAFDAQGVHFGSLFAGDGGRNYVRSNDEDYATVDFQAEVTFVVTDFAFQAAFFGLGSGDTALFGVPDWSTQFASVFIIPEINATENILTHFYTNDDIHNDFTERATTMLVPGSHRLRLTFDSDATTAQFAIDLNYAGGAFTADTTGPVVDLSEPAFKPEINLFGATGWPGEPSRIFFGGDDDVVFKDFSVTVTAPPAATGDFDADGDVDGADFVAWQRGLGTASGATRAQGDSNMDGDVDADDLATWKAQFGTVASGSIAAGVVPEPAALALLAIAGGAAAFARRRSH